MPNKKILVVEDEEQVRSLIVRLLEKRGYAVAQAENGRQALELASACVHEYALVITDIIMPVMGGAALLHELRSLRPDLPFLCMTGYTRDEVISGNESLAAHVIEKPFTPAALLEQVENILAGS